MNHNKIQSESASPLSLCKVGGSLLDWDEFPDRLQDFLTQLNTPALLLAGGGNCANLVRQWDRQFNLGEERSHQLAINAISLTASLLCSVLPGSCLVKNQKQLESALIDGQIPVLDASSWIQQHEATAQIDLPHTWKTTSDSIALWLAAELGIEHLILLKSVDYPAGINLETASSEGLIDAGFPEIFKQIADQQQPINFHWCNLRSDSKLISVIE